MTREEILDAIDELVIYEKDYDIIRLLLDNTDDEFFVKIIEEVVNNNLYFSDFDRMFTDSRYGSILEQNLESQAKLRTEIERIIAFRKEYMKNNDYTIDLKTTRLGIFVPDDNDTTLYDFYDEEVKNIIDNSIFELFESIPSDNDMIRAAKFKVYEKFEGGDLKREDFLLFAKEYIIPLAYEHQVLNKTDIDFMIQNGLTEEQVKKIKALTMFIKKSELK